MATRLSDHFTLEELTETVHRDLDNTPTPEIIEELTRLGKETLEAARSLIGPIRISSGYRSPAVNKAVNGQLNSQHMKGEAADCLPLNEGKLKDFAKTLLDSEHFVYDQIIYEFGRWIHISHAPVNREPRMQALMIGEWTKDENGKARYLDFDYDAIP